METASTVTTVLFVALVAVMAVVVVRTVRRAFGAGALTWIAAIVAAYLVIPAILARAGVLDRYAPMPAPGMILLLLLGVGTVTLAFSRFGTRVAAVMGITWLVGFQAFRVVVEWLLHRLYLEGAVPVQMTWSGRNFDVISGLTALVLGLWLARAGRRPTGVILAWNVLGFALLVNIIAVAVLSAPVPFRKFMEDPPNLLPSTFPFIWLPTFLVQLGLFGHLVVFRELMRRDQGAERP